MADIEGLLSRGADALRAGDWPAARAAFEAVLDAHDRPEALDGLADALWWQGDTLASVAARERAYTGFRAAAEYERAAGCALALSIHHRANVGDDAAASGWLARARRLVADNGLTSLGGWITLFDAGEAADPAAIETGTREALEAARLSGDIDLELSALAQLGSCLVGAGRVAEGVSLLDEAMAASLGGEPATFDTVVFTSCNMIGACTRCGEFERAISWIRAADRFTSSVGCPFLYLYCRTHYGAILIATGDWIEAEAQLSTAMRESEGSQQPLALFAAATLGWLRLLQGRLEDAAALVDGFDGQGPAAPVAAGLALARGEHAVAAAIATRNLDGADELGRAELLEIVAEAELAQGKADAAAARGRELISLGTDAACEIVRARGNRVLGRATNDRAALDAALNGFANLGMPYEVAVTRLALARAARADAPDVAVADAKAALEVFEGLGAGRGADDAAALLRAMGIKAARRGPRGQGTLTKREQEVLDLIAEGLSNPEIAERLFLSRKTVEHHVASILTKLGARNRADAVRLAAT